MTPTVEKTRQTSAPLFVPTGTGIAFNESDKRGNIAISAASTSDAFSLMVVETDYQAGIPPHVHRQEDETFYVLEGRFVGQGGGEVWEMGPGDTMYIPREVVNSWQCVSETGGRVVVFVTPGNNFETFFGEMGRTTAAARASGNTELGPVLGALSQQYGITMMPRPQDVSAYKPTRSPLYLPAGGGVHNSSGDHQGWIKIGAQHTVTDFLLAEAQVDKNGGVPPHIHHREDETFFVVEGKIEFQVGEQVWEAGPGDAVYAPRGIVHAFRCTSDGGARMLGLFTPGNNFQEFSTKMAELSMTDPASLQKFMEIAVQNGIEMLADIK